MRARVQFQKVALFSLAKTKSGSSVWISIQPLGALLLALKYANWLEEAE